MESLKGHFLIATAQMPDPRFREQVVYICAHTAEGAMGLVVNHPIPDLTLADILESTDLPVPSHQLPSVYMGGPVEIENGFFLHSAEYHPRNYIEVSDKVILSRDPDILRDITQGRGPAQYLFLLGYAGWAPGQLEHELTVNGWLTVPGDEHILFHTPDEQKWKEAAKGYGIDISLYGDVIGSA